jgi:hypothetical protein
MFVEAFRVERGDLVVLLAVVDEYFASSLFKPWQSRRKCADISGIQCCCRVRVSIVVPRRVPGWVTVDNVFEPSLCVSLVHC